MNYLMFVQYSAENLQFYLWLLDYEKRWNALVKNQQDLSPEWEPTMCPSADGCTLPALKSAVIESPWNSPLNSDFDSKSGKSNQLLRSPSKVFLASTKDKEHNPFSTPASSQLSLKANGSIVSVDTLPWSALGARIPTYSTSTIETALSIRKLITLDVFRYSKLTVLLT